ncbi:hypothetical protein CPB86DRAFT_225962 [Serendipita vermifera]|nr:hypothetical protein CPB86DRAFT_225962 [Serendipita vermifera]
MIYVGGDRNDESGTDENPLSLVGDSVEGWELFLSILFPDVPTRPADVYNDSRLYKFFTLAHKYSMELIEEDIIKYLENCNSLQDVSSLLVVAQIVGSTSLYDKAKGILIKREDNMTLEDARRIGLDTAYEILIARNKMPRHKCPTCFPRQPVWVYCEECDGTYQSHL